VGAEPIFGNLYNLPVYADPRLGDDPYLVFRDGTHSNALKVATVDFLRLAEPEVFDLGCEPNRERRPN
jgi:Ala-tRNA(Pro) deacylase